MSKESRPLREISDKKKNVPNDKLVPTWYSTQVSGYTLERAANVALFSRYINPFLGERCSVTPFNVLS